VLIDRLIAARPDYRYPRLNKAQAESLLHRTLGLIFPHFSNCPNTRAALMATAERVEADLHELCGAVGIEDDRADTVIDRYLEGLAEVAAALHEDAAFIADGDPAARSVDEVVLAYPGFFAIAAYRIAHVLVALDVPVVARLITEYAHQRTGVDIHPGATIGVPFFIDHGTGVVIGETARIGRRVKIYQGVTLGAHSVNKEDRGAPRHPKIEDDVVLYANATVLGGDTVIGAGSVIGGNVWLTSSVPKNAVVVRRAEIRVRTPESPPEDEVLPAQAG
jgi:serine O-acetyltransferase